MTDYLNFVIGEKNINEFGKFLRSLDHPKKVSLISGENVKKFLQKKIERSLSLAKIRFVWHEAKSNEIKLINQIQKNVKKDKN